MIATTIEQGRRLLELGISPDTADMYWDIDQDDSTLNVGTCCWDEVKVYDRVCPAWSTEALLEMIPSVVVGKTGDGDTIVYNGRIFLTGCGSIVDIVVETIEKLISNTGDFKFISNPSPVRLGLKVLDEKMEEIRWPRSVLMTIVDDNGHQWRAAESEVVRLIDRYMNIRLSQNQRVAIFKSTEREGYSIHLQYKKTNNRNK